MAEGSEGQVPDVEAQAADTTAGTQSAQDAPSDNEISKLRAEAAKYRTELRAAQKQAEEYKSLVDKAEAEKLTELEKAQKAAKENEDRAAAAEAKLRTTNLRLALSTEAAKQGAGDVELVVDLLAVKQWEFDADGRPVGVDSQVKELLKLKPILLAGTGTSATNPTKQADSTAQTTVFRQKSGAEALYGPR